MTDAPESGRRFVLPSEFPSYNDRPFVKVCGLTRAEDALLALELGASFLGLIFAENTPRLLSQNQARALLADVRMAACGEPVRPVGVFVHEPIEFIHSCVHDLELAAVQLHTTHSLEDRLSLGVPVIQAIRMRGPESAAEIDRALIDGPVLLDAFVEGQHGGTGRVFDHELAFPHVRRGPMFIAGGLNPENIAGIAARFREEDALPYVFDVSSGLEAEPRIKSHDKMRAFFRALEFP